MSTEPSIRDLQRRLEQQQRVIGRLQEQVQSLRPGDYAPVRQSVPGIVNRRSVLAALGFALLPAALAERATADDAADYACVWLGNQDANGFQLDDLEEINFSDGTTLSTASGTGGSGALTDSGSDNADGGDQYQLPQAEDSIDLQSAGDIENAASIATEELTTAGFTGTPVWKEESSSPYTATGASSATSINPSGLDAFDSLLVYVKATDQSSTNASAVLTVNGDTGTNYAERQGDGTRNTGQNEWGPVIQGSTDATVTSWFSLSNFRGGASLNILNYNSFNSLIIAGENTNISWPITQFTLDSGADWDWEVRVWGRDI